MTIRENLVKMFLKLANKLEANFQYLSDNISDLASFCNTTLQAGILDLQNNKVSKVTGKALSTNDYTNAEKLKLEGLSNYDDTELRALINTKQNTGEYALRSEIPTDFYSKYVVDSKLSNKQNKLRAGNNIEYSYDYQVHESNLDPTYSNQKWNGVAYGNNKFISLMFNSNKYAYSYDGVTWTEANLPLSCLWNDIIFVNGVYIAVGGADSAVHIATSSDGVIWNAESYSITNGTGNPRICYGNNIYAITCTDEVLYATNNNLANFARATLPSGYSWQDICYGNGKFVIKVKSNATNNNSIFYTTDFVNWSESNLSLDTENMEYVRKLYYLNGEFVVYVTNSNMTDNGYLLCSSDLSQWVKKVPNMVVDNIFYLNNKYHSINDKGKHIYSNDLVTWTELSPERTDNKNIFISNYAFSDNCYAFVGQNGSYALVYEPVVISANLDANYYTKQEVENIIDGIDLSDYYSKTECDNKYLTQHQDISGKANSSDLAAVATSGSYNDLTNKPTIPDAQIQSDWNQTTTTAKDYIKNKPTIPTVPTNISSFNNDSGYITGITSSDVTTALGYTPYNSSNPNGYQTNVIETVKVNGTAQTVTSKAIDISVPTNNNQLTNGAGYITSSALPTKVSDLTNDSGFITGIDSSDVTTALGYTPYNSSNPNGYTSNTGTVTSVNNVSPVNGNVTLSIPDAQVQSNWNETDTSSKAYIQNKPTIPTVPTVLSSFTDDLGSNPTHTHSQYLTSHQDVSGKANTADLATVATSGSYNDLTNKPTIPTVPTALSGFTDDLGSNPTHTHSQYLTQHQDISSKADNSAVVKLDSGSDSQTIQLTSGNGTTPLVLRSKATTCYLSFNANGTWKGSFGVDTNKKPIFYNGTGYTLAYTSDIPTKVSDLTNDSGYTSNAGTITGITMNGASKGTSGVVDLGTVITSHQDISGKENSSNKVTSLSSSSTDAQYPSAKCVYDIVGNIETLLSQI